MIHSTIFLYFLAAIASTVGGIIMLIAKEEIIVPFYVYFSEKKWSKIPIAAAQVLYAVIKTKITTSNSKTRNMLRIFLLSSGINILTLLATRLISTNSLELAIRNIFSQNLASIALLLCIVNGLLSIPAICTTFYCIKKCAEATKTRQVFAWWSVELLSTYLFVSASLFISGVLLLPVFSLSDGNLESALSTLKILLSFQYKNSIQWLWTDQPLIDSTNLLAFSLSSFFPTILFFVINLISFLSFSILWKTTPAAINLTSLVETKSQQHSAKVIGSGLVVIAATLTAWGKFFGEL